MMDTTFSMFVIFLLFIFSPLELVKNGVGSLHIAENSSPTSTASSMEFFLRLINEIQIPTKYSNIAKRTTPAMDLRYLGIITCETFDKVNTSCVGIIVSDRWFLFPWHCLFQKSIHHEKNYQPIDELYDNIVNVKRCFVSGGETIVPAKPENVQFRRVLRVIPHPQANYLAMRDNDLALAQTAKKFDFSNSTITAAQLQHEFKPLNNCVAAGFAFMPSKRSAGLNDLSMVKKFSAFTKVDLMNFEKCAWQYEKVVGLVMDSQEKLACATADGLAVCEGDSGNPFICENVVIGITSVSLSCGQTPVLLTRLPAYSSWINYTINKYLTRNKSEELNDLPGGDYDYDEKNSASDRKDIGYNGYTDKYAIYGVLWTVWTMVLWDYILLGLVIEH